MRFEKIPSFPVYLILLPLFYVWHKMNEYYGLISWRVAAEGMAEYSIVAVALISLAALLLRNLERAAFISAFLLCIYLFWGSIHDFLKTFLPSFLSSYGFLFPLIVVITVVILIWQKKKKPQQIRTSRFLNLALSLLLLIELATTAYYTATSKLEKSLITKQVQPSFNPPAGNDRLPDIFFIVFDEYMSSEGIRKYLHYDNSAIDSLLRSAGFYVAASSQSNYNSTPHVIASSLSMDYFPAPLELSPTDPTTLLAAQKAIQSALVPSLLARNGYNIINCGRMDLPGAPSPTEPIFDSYQYAALYSDNLRFRVHNEIWWNFTQRFEQLRPGKKYWEKRQDKKTTDLHNTISSLSAELQKETSKPRFVMGHFLLPHSPYIFDSAGNSIEWKNHPASITDSLYFEQVKYANTLIRKITEQAIAPSARKKVVIIMGDHGLRDNHLEPGKRTREKQFMNLTAIYFDDKNYSQLYDSISPVNIFRVVFNKQFGSHMPMLPDSTILLR